MLISIVIPCYRSGKTLPFVVAEIQDAFAGRQEYDYQIVLVNDGSPDDTYSVICGLCAENSKIIGIDLSRNFGQARARMAALPFVRGEYLVCMDDDGQHPAQGIFSLVRTLQEGYDVAFSRFTHKRYSLFKRATSKLFRQLLELMGSRPKGVYISSFFACNQFTIEALKKYQSPSPTVVSYLAKVTTRITDVEVEHRERKAGHSGYTLGRLIDLALMSFTNFTVVPLRIVSVLGFLIAGIGFLAGTILVVRKLLNPAIAMGYTSLMAVLLLLGGTIIFTQGLLGEYVGHMYMMLSNLPQYMIRETRNSDKETVETEMKLYVQN